MAETMMNPDLFPGLRQYLVEHFGPQAGRRLIFPGATEADEEPLEPRSGGFRRRIAGAGRSGASAAGARARVRVMGAKK
ncbi:MAG: hypothetical protein WEB59_00710 [Thermoanaerobaculia bacterium]